MNFVTRSNNVSFVKKKKKPGLKLNNLKASKIQTPCYYLIPHSPNA